MKRRLWFVHVVTLPFAFSFGRQYGMRFSKPAVPSAVPAENYLMYPVSSTVRTIPP